jgi:hypothetical protein
VALQDAQNPLADELGLTAPVVSIAAVGIFGRIFRWFSRCHKAKETYECMTFLEQFNEFEAECERERDKDEMGFIQKYGGYRAQRACGRIGVVNPASLRYSQLCCVILRSYKKEARDPTFDGDDFRKGFQKCLHTLLTPTR